MKFGYLAIILASCALSQSTHARDFNVTITTPDALIDGLCNIARNPAVSETALILGALYATPILTKMALSGFSKISQAASGVNQKFCSMLGMHDAAHYIERYQKVLTKICEDDELAALIACSVILPVELAIYLRSKISL